MKLKKPKPPQDDPEQSVRFVEAAKETGAATGKDFAYVLKQIISKRQASKRKPHS